MRNCLFCQHLRLLPPRQARPLPVNDHTMVMFGEDQDSEFVCDRRRFMLDLDERVTVDVLRETFEQAETCEDFYGLPHRVH